MGLTENQKNMIRCLANKDIKNTREWAKVVLMDDNTQKNKSFVERYLPILANPTGYTSEDIPLDLRGILQYEDVSETFIEDRYYVTEEQKALAEKILQMEKVSQRLEELQVPYKNATLLYGPPGTGKTMFGKYIAYKSKLPFFYLNFSRLIDSHMGATSKNISKAFDFVSFDSCVFLLDEVDAISCNRQNGSGNGVDGEIARTTITLMQEFDKLPNDIIVLAATNRLDILDEAFISRFSIKRKIEPFTEEENRKMVQLFLDDVDYSFTEDEINTVIASTHDQREIMNRTIQVLAGKIAEE